MTNLSSKVAEAKSWWRSKSIIGTILMILPTIIRMIKPEWTLDLEAGTEAVFSQAGEIANQIDSIWVTLSQTIGVLLTAVGLRTAKQPLK